MYCIIITTTDDLIIAEKLASELIKNCLAACVQIEKIKSYYKWEEKINNSKEYRLNIKTLSSKYNRVESF